MNGNPSPVSAESIKAKLKDEADSCVKDFNYLLFHYFFDGASLSEAIAQTFKRRNTEFFPSPIVFTDDFLLLPNKQIQWQAFQRRTGIVNVPEDFSVIVATIKRFLFPVYEVLANKGVFSGLWDKEKEMWYKNSIRNNSKV